MRMAVFIYRRILSVICVCLTINTGYGYIRKFSEEDMCNSTITFGDGIYAVSLDFDFVFRGDYAQCQTKIQIPESYTVAYRFLSHYSYLSSCDTWLNVSYNGGFSNYQFCKTFSFHGSDVILKKSRELTLNFRTDNDQGEYDMLMYIFKSKLWTCDTASVRCKNGRCIDRGLFCDIQYNFCGDTSSTGMCTDDQRKDYDNSYAFNKLNIIGPVCLGLFIILTLVVIVYLCCRNKTFGRLWGVPGRQNRSSRPPLTARDVYIINVSDVGGTPEEGYDYVTDYKTYAAPPEYSSLENIAEACVRYTNNSTDNSEIVDASNDIADGATGGENTNDGFTHDDENKLPAYDHVMTNTEHYNVNHNKL